MTLLFMNLPKALLDAAAISAGLESEPFALPDGSTSLTWQTFFGVAPASCTFKLWGSLDGETYAVIDTSTIVGGEIKTINTNVKFVYVELDAVSGGSGGVSVWLVAKDI